MPVGRCVQAFESFQEGRGNAVGRILIADASELWRNMLERALKERHQVRSCSDGLQAMALLEEFAPELLVMDPMLPGADGLRVLKQLEENIDRPRVLITSRYYSQYLIEALERCGADELILKPCDVRDIEERAEELLAVSEPEAACTDAWDQTTRMLTELGITPGSRGFRCLRAGVLLLMEDPEQQLTKVLYPAIGAQFGTTGINVEKCLRTAVTNAWLRRRDSVWRSYFPAAPDGRIPKPTAGQFLGTLTDLVRSKRKRA